MSLDVEALKKSADIVSVVGSYVELKKRGGEYLGLCPFHSDTNPSFYVIPAKQFCHCFACGASHDVISFVQEIEGVDFKTACEKLGATEQWKPAKPIKQEAKVSERVTSKPPADAKPPEFATRALGPPEKVYALLDLDGATLGYEARYRGEEGKKVVLMWTWGARGSAAPAWGMGAFNVPRPLFGLQRLALDPAKPVSIFEGPKKAEAGAQLLGQWYAYISWTGGANAWHKHDWAPLRGRRVLIWPDADEPGVKAVDALSMTLQALGCNVAIVDPTTGEAMPEGWDVADALEEGWSAQQLVEWAKPRKRPPAIQPKDSAPDAESPSAAATAPAAPVAEPIPLEAYREEAKPRRKRARLAVVNSSTDAPDPEEEPLPQPLSEDALADRFGELHKDNWRHVSAWDKWFHWDGDGWAEDREYARVEPMRSLFRQATYWPEAAALTPDAKRRMCRQATIYATVRLAGTDRRIRTTPEVWDADPWMLGVPGGVVDLREGKLIEASRDQCITMRCAVAPDRGTPEIWLKMLSYWTGGDAELIGWLRRYLGYALTGDNREQCMAFFYGPSQAGKGTIIRTISGILGSLQGEINPFRSYHFEAPIATFMESRNDRHSTELAALYGKRLITAEEPTAGAKWDEGKLKWITGGSQITARFIGRDNFSFTMTGKIIVAANHRPRLSTTDKAIRRRLHVVPFEHPVSDEDRDNQLDAKLRAEWPRILHWLIEGCLEWQEIGLGLPERIAASTDTYLESEDTLGAWLEDCCERNTSRAEARALYESYRKWAENNGEHAWTRRAWANAMVERGFQPCKGTAGMRMFAGISLKIQPYQPSYPQD